MMLLCMAEYLKSPVETSSSHQHRSTYAKHNRASTRMLACSPSISLMLLGYRYRHYFLDKEPLTDWKMHFFNELVCSLLCLEHPFCPEHQKTAVATG